MLDTFVVFLSKSVLPKRHGWCPADCLAALIQLTLPSGRLIAVAVVPDIQD